MNNSFHILLDLKGNVLDYKLPFTIEKADQIGDILPIYADLNSFPLLTDFNIEAYEFHYGNHQYFVDVILKKEDEDYLVVFTDKTIDYQQKIMNQSVQNKLRIETEYLKINQKFLNSKINFLEYIVSSMSEVIEHSIKAIDSNLEALQNVNTYVKDDANIISNTVSAVNDETKHILTTLDHASIYSSLNPSTILENPEYLPLAKLIKSIAEENKIPNGKIKLNIDENQLVYGNPKFYKSLMSYYCTKNIHPQHHIEFNHIEVDENLIKLQVNYFKEEKEFIKPQQISHKLIFPLNNEVESDEELVKTIFNSIKRLLLKQVNLLNYVAA